jgi:hypothetical protein
MAQDKRHRVLVLTLGIFLGAAAGCGQTAIADDVLSPLVATPLSAPNPVLGADDKTHLAYEIVLMNMGSATVGLDKIETLDAISGAVLSTLEGEALAQMLQLNSGAKGSELSAGGSGVVFMDITLDNKAAIPKKLKHRFKIAVAKKSSPDRGGDRDVAPELPQEITFVGDPLDVGAPAVVVTPPLQGKLWVAAGGCCTPYSYHRGATLPINGKIRVAQRYAIDFVQLNDKNMIYSGPRDQLSSYAFFGDEIHSVADGIVVEIADSYPEQVPGKLPEGMKLQMLLGNHVVVDIGEGHYAFYAHMQPGGLRVKVGDKVVTGQVLGVLGNSGNTDAPHLHFHVMNGPSPLLSNGLPYVFTSFEGQGVLRDEKPLFTGGEVNINESALAGPHKNQLPLNDEVVSFP